MNTLVKVGVAGALAMGAMSANAGIVTVNSYGTTDYMLFAEVLSGTTVVGSYAGDSGIAETTALTSGTVGGLSTTSDAALASLISIGTSAGNTIEWGVMGGSWSVPSAYTTSDSYVTTLAGNSTTQMVSRTGTNTSVWAQGLLGLLTTVASNAGTANSVYATTTAKGGIWDVTTLATNNPYNWFGAGSNTANQYGATGITLFALAGGAGTTNNITTTALGTIALTSTGLTFTAGNTSVPLPAAIWLLGGGLLGLAGVGRRKTTAA